MPKQYGTFKILGLMMIA